MEWRVECREPCSAPRRRITLLRPAVEERVAWSMVGPRQETQSALLQRHGRLERDVQPRRRPATLAARVARRARHKQRRWLLYTVHGCKGSDTTIPTKMPTWGCMMWGFSRFRRGLSAARRPRRGRSRCQSRSRWGGRSSFCGQAGRAAVFQCSSNLEVRVTMSMERTLDLAQR